MILQEPLKGKDIQYVKSLHSSQGMGKMFKPFLRLTTVDGQRYHLSFENLQRILATIDFDVDQKKIRKHLIPLLPDGQCTPTGS